jgi:ribosomal protein S18 acetylase RimI-like enzyme
MFFADARLARRVEAADCRLIADAARTVAARQGADGVLVREIGGGVAVFAGAGAPWNKLAGLGFGGLDEAALGEIEREFRQRAAPLQVEFPTLGDNAICATLTRRGYALVGFENVLGLRLDGLPPREPPLGIEITEAAEAESRTWIGTLLDGFEHPDVVDGPTPHEAFDRSTLERVFADFVETPGIRRYLARIGGSIAGGASQRTSEGIAQLCGAATLPSFRRRGVQTALLHARLRAAAAAGCDLAVVTTQPGSKSQSNVQREGFALLYTRAVLVLEPRP